MAKTISQNVLKGVQVIEVQYDFANDGGSIGVLDLFTAPVKMVVHQAYLKVVSTCTSADAAVLEVGIKAGDTDALIGATAGAVANLVEDAVLKGETTSVGLFLDAGDVIAMEISAFALTAGKFKLVLVTSDF